jgi:hypothetical protein
LAVQDELHRCSATHIRLLVWRYVVSEEEDMRRQ